MRVYRIQLEDEAVTGFLADHGVATFDTWNCDCVPNCGVRVFFGWGADPRKPGMVLWITPDTVVVEATSRKALDARIQQEGIPSNIFSLSSHRTAPQIATAALSVTHLTGVAPKDATERLATRLLSQFPAPKVAQA